MGVNLHSKCAQGVLNGLVGAVCQALVVRVGSPIKPADGAPNADTGVVCSGVCQGKNNAHIANSIVVCVCNMRKFG